MALPLFGLAGAALTSKWGIRAFVIIGIIVAVVALFYFWGAAIREAAVGNYISERLAEENAEYERQFREFERRLRIRDREVAELRDQIGQLDLDRQDILTDIEDEQDGDIAPVTRRTLERLQELEDGTPD